MKRMFFTLAVLTLIAVTGGSASAQAPAAGPGCAPGPVGPPPGYGGMAYGPSYGGYGGYGMGVGGHLGGHGLGGGFLSGIFSNHGHKDKKGLFGRGDRERNAQTLPVAQGGGTLVYPQNPFVRSPRDFFMWDER